MTAAQALLEARKPRLPAGVAYALLQPGRAKPLAYARLPDLARSLQARRAGRPLELVDQAGVIAGHDQPLPGVSVWILDADGARTDSLGWAYLQGAGRQQLQAAIHGVGQ